MSVAKPAVFRYLTARPGRVSQRFSIPALQFTLIRFEHASKDAVVDIREFRIDQFGCWQDVAVNALPTGVNVIQLDDGGRPADLSDFFCQVLFGFDADNHVAAGGALFFDDGENTLAIDRQTTSTGSTELQAKWNGSYVDSPGRFLDVATASLDEALARRIFVPNDSQSSEWKRDRRQPGAITRQVAKDNWTWLLQQDDLLERLQLNLPPQAQVDSPIEPPTMAASPKSVSAQKNINELDVRLTQLQKEQATLEQQLQSGRERMASVQTRIAQQSTSRTLKRHSGLSPHELEDELVILRSRQLPLKQALGLVDQWKERASLRVPESDAFDLRVLRKAFAKWKETEKEVEKYSRVLKERKSTKVPEQKRDRSALRRIDLLLSRQEWVLESSTAAANSDPAFPPATAASISERNSKNRVQIPPGVEFAAGMVREEQLRAERAEQDWLEFSNEHGTDWETSDDDSQLLPMEIAQDSLLADAPLAKQLEELKRRRLWIEQEYQCLLERTLVHQQPQAHAIKLTIILVFCLSIASLFGVLVVLSYLGQLALIAIGLSGIVAAGALRLSLEKRALERIRRAQSRLNVIDQGIDMLTERIWNQDRAAQRARLRERATELQEALAIAHRRVDGAEIAFREALFQAGWPATLQVDDLDDYADRIGTTHQNRDSASPPQQTTQSTSSENTTENEELQAWIQAARELVARQTQQSAPDDPIVLLGMLEQLREQAAGKQPVSDRQAQRDQRNAAVQLAKQQIRKLNKAQQAILKKVKMHDVFELESAIEKALHRQELRQQWEQLDREIQTQLDASDDRMEIQELLETYDRQQLETRLKELQSHEEDLTSMRDQSDLPSKTNSLSNELAVIEREMKDWKSQLPEVKQSIQDATAERQRWVSRHADFLAEESDLAEKMATKSKPKVATSPACSYLRQLSEDRFDVMYLKDGKLNLAKQDTPGSGTIVELDSSDAVLAWLAIRFRTAAIHQQEAGHTLPLVFQVDPLLNSLAPDLLFAVFESASNNGLQVILLSGVSQHASALADLGASAVRIGLQEEVTTVADDRTLEWPEISHAA